MMSMKTRDTLEMDVLAHAAEYAAASGAPENPDHLGNLRTLLDMLIQKRRNNAQDAITYPIAFMGRCLDISRLQPVIEALERAIADEERRAQS